MDESSVQVDVAQTLLQILPTLDLGLEFKCERSYADWELPLKIDTPLRVDIVPVSALKTELEDRSSMRYLPDTQIIVRRKFDSDSSDDATGRIEIEEIDSLVLFVQKINARLVAKRIGDDGEAVWESSEIVASYMPKHLREHRQFTAIIRVTDSVVMPLPKLST